MSLPATFPLMIPSLLHIQTHFIALISDFIGDQLRAWPVESAQTEQPDLLHVCVLLLTADHMLLGNAAFPAAAAASILTTSSHLASVAGVSHLSLNLMRRLQKRRHVHKGTAIPVGNQGAVYRSRRVLLCI